MHRLRKFAEKHGHARVPYRYVTADGHKLGSWVAMQRHWRERLSPEQERLLEEVPGWVWKIERGGQSASAQHPRSPSDPVGKCTG